jgi:hypothetical protein
VAAQQAALAEEEGRLQQRRVALEQQEKQLADHLESKRLKLEQLRDQARQARAELQQEKKLLEERTQASARDLARQRQELEEGRRQTTAEHNRLRDLQRRLKQRWHRHWAAERQAQRRREAEVAGQARALDRDKERLDEERAALTRERLRWNGERELGRRQIQDAWLQFRQAQHHRDARQARDRAELRERDRKLREREADLARARRELEEEKRHWQTARRHLEKEAEGLENRARNQRRKVLELRQEVLRLGGILQACRENAADRNEYSQANEGPPAEPPAPALDARQRQFDEAEDDFLNRLAALEQVADDLVDQRLHLAEQWEGLLRTRRLWQEDHAAAAAELEAVALRLRQQEQSLSAREQRLAAGELHLRRRVDEVVRLRQQLEGSQARLRARVAAWEGERETLLVEMRTREELAEKRLAAAAEQHALGEERRRDELTRFQASLAAAEQLRREWAELREDGLRRQALLEQRERDLAEKTLALEECRQELLGRSPDSPAVERRLERLRRRWASLSAAAERGLARQRRAWQAERARFEDRCRRFHQHAHEVAAREVQLAVGLGAWEHEQALVRDRFDQLRQEVQTLQGQRRHLENQLDEVRAVVEQVARLLLDDVDTAPAPAVGQAA